MNKRDWAALVNTLRVALAEAQRDRDLARDAERRVIAECGEIRRQVRALEQRAGAPYLPPLEQRLRFEETLYRPAREGETPDILVRNIRIVDQPGELPYVKVR